MHLIRRKNERVYHFCENNYVACTFQAEKFRSDGTVTYQGPVFSNTILNTGLDLLASEAFGVGGGSGNYINVGTDNTSPAQNQSGLLSFLASTTNIYTESTGYDLANPAHKWREATFEFAIGSCTGNLTELGLSADSNSNYFNRQLFRDGVGDPTTITVTSSEGLRITSRIYFYPDLQPGGTTTGSFTLNGSTTKNYTREMTTSNNWADHCEDNNIISFGFHDKDDTYLSDAIPAWSGNQTTADSYSTKTYSPGDYYLDFEFVWQAGTFVGDIAAIRFEIYYSRSSLDEAQFTSFNLDSVISVVDTEEVTFTLRRAWGRY